MGQSALADADQDQLMNVMKLTLLLGPSMRSCRNDDAGMPGIVAWDPFTWAAVLLSRDNVEFDPRWLRTNVEPQRDAACEVKQDDNRQVPIEQL